MIRKWPWLFAALVVVSGRLVAAGETPHTWTGYITDTHCGRKAASRDHSVACVEKCMKDGSKAQILNEADNTIYDLDSFDKVRGLMGNKVTITGTLDTQTHAIRVESATKAKSKERTPDGPAPGPR